MASARLRARLAGVGLEEDGTPDRHSWERLLAALDEDYAGIEAAARTESERGWSSFENLFRISPTPLIEQDYTEFERWLGELREAGVSDLREWFSRGDALALIRQVVPKVRIVAANPAALDAVGLPLDQFLGPVDPVIVNEGSEPSWLAQFDAVWNAEPEAHASFVAATPGGRTYDAESVLAAPVIHGRPDFSRAVFTVIDVTPHRDEERRMQELMEGKNRFLAAVSHEIRTPLTAILGFARLLGEGGGDVDQDERADMLRAVVENAQEMADLVDDLLVAARVETGEVELHVGTIDAAAQVRQTLAASRPFTGGVSVDLPTGPVATNADPARVRQILRNLLTNADRYGGPDVRVAVRGGAATVVEVSDDGPGVPHQDRERIFEPYLRAHHSAGQPESVGIGLAISRQLAEAMGGSLVYDRIGGRSVFRLELPAG